jgi:hypothetical protein
MSKSLNHNTGSINERGIINNLTRKGFTIVKCGSELIANSIDAKSSNIIFVINDNCIKLIDDGDGMTFKKLDKMIDVNGEHHSEHKSMGVSGIGFTASSYILSKINANSPQKVIVYTKDKNSQHLKLSIPWDEIYTEGIITGKLKITGMSSQEIQDFNLERNANGLRINAGTTIVLPYSDNIRELLDEQFKETPQGDNLNDSWRFVFGKTTPNIMYYDGSQKYELSKYDYFNDTDEEFYCGKFYTQIYSFIDKNTGKNRFVCKNPYKEEIPEPIYMEIIKYGKGFSQEPVEVEINERIIENADVIYFVSGMRKCNEIFDIDNPKEINATYYVNDYDKQFIKENSNAHKFIGQISIFRNQQRITGFIPEGYTISSARGNGLSLTKLIYHRCSLSYEIESKQNNNIDEIHGIQENKNQNQNNFPSNYQRLVKYLKEYHCKKIQNYIDELCSIQPPPIQPPPIQPPPIQPPPIQPPAIQPPPIQPPPIQPPAIQPPAIQPPPIQPPPIQPPPIQPPPIQPPPIQPPTRVPALSYDDEIEESKKFLIDAAKLIMEIASDPNYMKKNGNDIYKSIKSLLDE